MTIEIDLLGARLLRDRSSTGSGVTCCEIHRAAAVRDNGGTLTEFERGLNISARIRYTDLMEMMAQMGEIVRH